MPLDSPVLRDGDQGFVGFASRLNPLTLPAGVLQLSENMRLDRGVATTRKGCKRMADDISVSSTPLTVPFVLTTPDQVVQSRYDGGIFAAGVMRSADEIGGQEIILLAGPDRVFVVIPDENGWDSQIWTGGPIVTNDGENILDNLGNEILANSLPASLALPSSPDETIESTDTVSFVQAYNRMYLLREADPFQPGWEKKDITTGGITVSGTTATVNLTAHGYPAGARVRIEGSSVAAFNNHEYDIATASTNSFTITVPSGTATDATTTGRSVRRVKAPLYWDGDPTTDFVRSPAGVPTVGPTFKRLRSSPWASYVNGRLVIPDGKDSVSISDFYDPNTYDPFWSSFRANQGSSDKLVGVHPWVDGSFLVFMRKSIWIATVSQVPALDGSDLEINTTVSRLELLTDEIGCIARRSIQTAGQFVYFLSDSGIYRLDSRLDLKLRGDTRPLSDPISDKVGEINADYAMKSVGLWHDNRYYLAAPTNGSENNNSLFIFNALNEQWETIDSYGWGVDDMLITSYANERRLFASSRAGFLMLLDEVEEGDESPDAQANVTIPVTGRITTRRFGMGSMSAKRFTRVVADAVLPNGAEIEVTANMQNPDKTELLVPGLANTTGTNEDYSLKLPIRHRCHYADLTITTKSGRPEIRTISIEAAGASLPQTETRIAA